MSATLTRGLAPVRTVLDNGAVVIAQETSMAPAVTINAAFHAGSLYEPESLTGLAHLTGRVIDRGTRDRSAETIAEQLDERGVGLRVAVSRHTLSISCTCLAEDFEEVLSIVADVARHPVFPEEEIEKRRHETITAIRQDEDNPAVRATETMFDLLYGASHPYARRAKGTLDSLERIDRRSIAAFHAAHVVPSALSVVIVGDIAAAKAVDAAASRIGDWVAAARVIAEVPDPPSRRERTESIVTIPGKSQSDIAYGFTTIRRRDPRYHAYWMMNNILGQFGLGGRLADNIRERQGMAYYAYSAFDPSIGVGPLIVRAGVDPKNVERAVAAIDTEVRILGTAGPTADEVDETRASLVGSIPRMLETNPAIATFLQTVEQFELGLDYDQRLPGLLRAVTFDEIAAAAREVLHPDRASIGIAGPRPA
jgi:zinc protease